MKIIIKLDDLLGEQNMSQHELSRKTGVRQPTINAMRRNQSKRIPLDNLASVCEVLECDITDALVLKKSPLNNQRLFFCVFIYRTVGV